MTMWTDLWEKGLNLKIMPNTYVPKLCLKGKKSLSNKKMQFCKNLQDKGL